MTPRERTYPVKGSVAECAARILSLVLHPLMVPLYVVLVAALSDPYLTLLPARARWYVAMVVLLNALIAPALAIALLRSLRWISGAPASSGNAPASAVSGTAPAAAAPASPAHAATAASGTAPAAAAPASPAHAATAASGTAPAHAPAAPATRSAIRRDSTIPVAIAALGYGIAVVMLKELTPAFVLIKILLAAFCCAVAALAAGFFWRVSLHMAAVGGAVAVLFLLSIVGIRYAFFPLVVAIALAGALASARLYLGAHSPARVYGGFALGFVAAGLGMLFVYVN